MRGAPLLQTILIVVAFLLAGVPTYRLTRPAAANATNHPSETPTPDHAPAKSAPLDVEVTFAPAPAGFEITNVGQPVLDGHGPGSRFAGRWNTTVPPEGADLVIQARWPAGGEPGAVRVIVRFPGGRTVEKTVWSDANGTLDDVFTVPGETTAEP